MHEQPTLDNIVEQLLNDAPDWLLRKKFSALIGGAYSVKSLANLDSEGKGIKPRMRVGGKIVYQKDAAISWLKQRCKIEEGNDEIKR